MFQRKKPQGVPPVSQSSIANVSLSSTQVTENEIPNVVDDESCPLELVHETNTNLDRGGGCGGQTANGPSPDSSANLGPRNGGPTRRLSDDKTRLLMALPVCDSLNLLTLLFPPLPV